MSSIERRDLLRGAGALAVTTPLRSAPRRSQPAAAFGWGVASFDPTDTSVLLWTRAVGPDPAAPVDLRWVVAADPALSDVVLDGTTTAIVDLDHCVTVQAGDLEAGRAWWYAFETLDGGRSTVGRTRTMPAGSSERIRVGVTSCSRFATAGFAAYAALAEHELDLVLHVGDYIYEDGEAGARAHEPVERLVRVEQYRARYAQHRSDADLQALHARHPMVAVWDDHDLAGNAWAGGARDHDEARDGPWPDRRRAATTARLEWLPARTGVDADGLATWWRALPLSTDVELVVLDTRSRRDRQPSPQELAADLSAATPAPRTLLGAEQEAFVADRLTREDRPAWVLLANQVMLHPLRLPVPTEELEDDLAAAGFPTIAGEAMNPDQWDGYPAARDQLLDAVGDRGGVVVLTGDVHSAWAWQGAGRPEPHALVELVASSASSAPLASRLPVSPALVEVGLTALDANLNHVDVEANGYLLVDVLEDRVQAEWWTVDPNAAGSQLPAVTLTAPRVPPMLLELTDPLPEPPAPTVPERSAGAADDDRDSSDDGWLVPALGGGGAAVVVAAGAALALRRRRSS